MALPSDLKTTYDKIVAATAEGQSSEIIEPYWAIEDEQETTKLDWFRRALDATENGTTSRMQRQLVNRFAYRGIQWDNQDPHGFFTNRRGSFVQSHKITVPDSYRYLENISSKLLRFKAKTLPGPRTNEFSDKQGARVAKMALEYVREQFSLDKTDRNMVRRLPLDGESYLFVLWEESKGPLTDRYKKAKEKYGDKKVRIKDWTYDPKKPEHVGEFCFIMPQPWQVRLDPNATCPEEVRWVKYIKHRHVKEVAAEYPEKRAEIEASASDSDFLPLRNIDTSNARQRFNSDTIAEVHFWHRKCKQLPKGAYICYVPGLILKDEENPYSDIETLEETTWGDLPIERLTDMDIDGHLHGHPSLSLIESFIRARNHILTSVNRNLLLFGSPKLLVHENSQCSIEALASGATILKWAGQEAPELKHFGAIPPEAISFFEMLGKELDRSVNLHPISSGEPPKGITAGVALRLLEDFENRLFEPQIEKLNGYIISRDRRILGMMGKFYKPEDKRLVSIVGEDNTDIIEELDISSLSRPYNIRLDPVSTQYDSAAARKQDVLDLLQYGPENVLAPEQILDALDLNRPEKIVDPAQTAVANAERVVEMISRGKEPPMPRPGENYLVKWKVFMVFYQRPSFEALPDAQKKTFIKMVTTLEWLMDEQAIKNPSYEQVLVTQPQWPAFYTPSPRVSMPMASQMMGSQAPSSNMNTLQAPSASFQPQPSISNDQLVN